MKVHFQIFGSDVDGKLFGNFHMASWRPFFHDHQLRLFGA